MIIVGGEFTVAPEDVDAFLAGRADSIRRSRAEKGNIEYTIAADPIVPGRLVLFEKWETRADLDAHVAAMPSAPPPTGPAPVTRNITVFDATEAAPLGS